MSGGSACDAPHCAASNAAECVSGACKWNLGASVCKTCNGIGLVSRHAQDGSHDDSPCPECSPLTHEGMVRQFRALLAD